MPSIRPERIGEEIRGVLAQLFREEMKDPRVGFVSIIKVEVARDMRVAKVYVSVLGDQTAKKNSLKGLESAAGYLRSELSQRMQIRYMPELRFLLDESIEHGVRISRLLAEAQKEQRHE